MMSETERATLDRVEAMVNAGWRPFDDRASALLTAISKRLLADRRFGPMIRDWEREGAVSRRAKWLATTTMAVCAVVMFLTAPKWWMAATGTAFMAATAAWLWRRPEPRQ